MESFKNDDELMSQSWKKVYNSATKAGYRDGIAAGRETTHQKSFDIGYSEGFRSGFALGFYKALLSSKPNFISDDTLLQKTTRGNCEICKNNELLNKTTSEIISVQSNSTKNVLEKLETKYNGDIQFDLSII